MSLWHQQIPTLNICDSMFFIQSNSNVFIHVSGLLGILGNLLVVTMILLDPVLRTWSQMLIILNIALLDLLKSILIFVMAAVAFSNGQLMQVGSISCTSTGILDLFWQVGHRSNAFSQKIFSQIVLT